MERRKLSVVAMLDDLTRFGQELIDSSSDIPFLNFVKNQDECRQLWLNSTLECEQLRSSIKKLEFELAASETKLKHCRNRLSMEMTKRMRVQREKEHYQQQIEKIKAFLISDAVNESTKKQLAFLDVSIRKKKNPNRRITLESSGSLLSPSDIDESDETLGDTDEDVESPEYVSTRLIDLPKYNIINNEAKKRSTTPPISDATSPKRTRPHSDGLVNGITGKPKHAVEPFTVNGVRPSLSASMVDTKRLNLKNELKSKVESKSLLNTTFITSDSKNIPPQISSTDSESSTLSSEHSAILSTPLNRIGKISTNARIVSKHHIFRPKNIVIPENCFHCEKRLLMPTVASKCIDCGIIRCIMCKSKSPVPCLPVFKSPRTTVGKVIADFAPAVAPCIPSLILLCIMEVEQRGLNKADLYRQSGVIGDIKKLKDKFLRSKRIPNLTDIDIHVICGCVKDFLRSLDEPLVTRALWHSFAYISEVGNEPEDICGFVAMLPDANKHTLAYLILHLKLVSRTATCRMPVKSLAVVFGPAVVGNSCLRPGPLLMISESAKQAAVMEMLLAVPDSYWSKILGSSNAPVCSASSTSSKKDFRFVSFKGRKPFGHSLFRLREDTVKTKNAHIQLQHFASPVLLK